MTDTATPLDVLAEYTEIIKRQRLSVDSLDAQPIETDWSEVDIDDLEVLELVRCEECTNVIHTGDEHLADCPQAGSDARDMGAEGPMMNYRYPISGVDFDVMTTLKLIDLPLCLVQYENDTYLALTGGGMDLSWEICHAYMELGSLPPIHFCSDLPRMAGMKLDRTNGLILAAAARSIEISGEWAESRKTRLERIVADMAEG